MAEVDSKNRRGEASVSSLNRTMYRNPKIPHFLKSRTFVSLIVGNCLPFSSDMVGLSSQPTQMNLAPSRREILPNQLGE